MRAIDDPRLITLDAMRGLAALMVVLYHLDFLGTFAPSGYLAVDFFFLLSGVVMARAYEQRLLDGLPVGRFLVERLVRLYPLFLLGFAIGLARRVAQILTHHPERMSWHDLGIASVFNVLMLPAPLPGPIAPVNGPSWSLFLELFVNVLWAALIVRMPTRTQFAMLGALACLAVAVFLDEGSASGGPHWATLHDGVLRATFGFSLGVVLAKVCIARQPCVSWFAPAAAMVLCICLMGDPHPNDRAWYDLAMILVGFPALVLIGAWANPPPLLVPLARTLGEMSYPMYVLHYGPLFTVAYAARAGGVSPGIWVPVFLVAMCIISVQLARTYDPWLRRAMQRRLAPRPR